MFLCMVEISMRLSDSFIDFDADVPAITLYWSLTTSTFE